MIAAVLLLATLARGAEGPTVDEGGAGPMEAYLARRITLVERPVTTVYAKAYDGSGRFWFVEQGDALLDASRFAQLTGDGTAATQLKRRRTTTTALGATSFVAGAGLGVLGAFLIGASGNQPEGASPAILTAAIAPPLLGIVGGTVLLGKGFRSAHPSAVYTRDQADERARAHNERLHRELFPE